MMSFACGYQRARPRQEIVEALEMEDRYFRELVSEIPEIITSSKSGYWILPLVDITGIEVKKAREVIEGEDRRRMIVLYLRQRKQRQVLRNLEGLEKQLAFV